VKKALLRGLPGKALSRIAAGKQRYLFFRTRPRQDYSRIICFENHALPMAQLELIPGETHFAKVSELTTMFLRFSGMSRNEWFAFWSGKPNGCAVEISSQCVIPENLRFNVVRYWRLNQPPQNFCYVPCPSWPLARPDVNKQPAVSTDRLL